MAEKIIKNLKFFYEMLVHSALIASYICVLAILLVIFIDDGIILYEYQIFVISAEVLVWIAVLPGIAKKLIPEIVSIWKKY